MRNVSVVEVNPLTTLITELRRQRPGLGFAGASLMVKRHFGVPGWADLGQDLRDGPHWFSPFAYVRDVARYGSIGRLDGALARTILGGSSRVRPPVVTGPVSASAASRPQARTAAKVTPGQLVKKVFGNLLGTAIEIKKQELVGGAVAALLKVAKEGLGLDLLGQSELDGVREQLDALGAQITQLNGKLDDVRTLLARTHASQLLSQSNDIIANIKWAQERLALLARMKPEDPTLTMFALTITNHIKNHLTTAPEQLDLQLSPTLAIGDNAIKATSRALASKRFFDARDSDEVRGVYDYFATWQAQLAVLLANYYNTDPGTYSVDTSKELLGMIQTNVIKVERESLKPPVPAGTFVDTRTPKFMWGTENQTLTASTLYDDGYQTRNDIRLGGFSNYQLPAFGDFRNLLDGATGSPRAWLQAQVKVPLSHQLLWASGSVVLHVFGRGGVTRYLQVRIFDLATGKEEQHGYGKSDWQFRLTCTGPCTNSAPGARFLSTKSGGLLLLRYLAPGESYWW